jgi:tetratricopeptide (TPR) repeat protein
MAGVLALHWERGGDLARAVACHARAADVARSRYSFDQAAAQYRHALLQRLPASPERDAQEMNLQSELVGCVFSSDGPGSTELESIAVRIDALSRTGATTPALLNSLFGLIALCITRGDLDRAETLCERALARAPEIPDAGGFFTDAARGLLGFTHLRRGRFADAIPHLRDGAALPVVGAVGMAEPSIVYASDLGLSLFLAGGLAALRASDADAEASGHPPTFVFTGANMMRIGQLIGDRPLVERVAATMGDVAERLAQPRFSAYRQICLGWLAMDVGEPGGIDMFRKGCATLAADSHLVYAPFSYAQAASALARLGRIDEARDVLAEALRALASNGARWCEPELHRVQGQIAAATAATPRPRTKARVQATGDAEASFRHAIALARAQGGRWWELCALFDLARLRPHDDETTSALRTLHDAIAAGVDAPALAAVRAFLAAAPS